MEKNGVFDKFTIGTHCNNLKEENILLFYLLITIAVKTVCVMIKQKTPELTTFNHLYLDKIGYKMFI